jgi:hypothetical protein
LRQHWSYWILLWVLPDSFCTRGNRPLSCPLRALWPQR